MISKLYHFILIAFFACFTILSCNGRDKVKITPQDSLKEKKLLDSFSENIKYFPEEYAEVETDTFLTNGFRVYIKSETDMNSSILNEFVEDTIKYKHYYRDIKVNVSVSKDEELIFESAFDKRYFKEKFTDYEEFFDEANLAGFWLNDTHSVENEVSINIDFCIPESDVCLFYILTVKSDGSYTIEEIEEY